MAKGRKAVRSTYRTQLRELVKEHYEADDRVTTRQLAEEMRERYPELVEDTKDAFYFETAQRWAREAMKVKLSGRKMRQLEMPGLLVEVTIPTHVAVRNTNTGEFIWTPIFRATINEARRHAADLKMGIVADTASLENLNTLLYHLRDFDTEEWESRSIGEIIDVMREEEGAASA